MTGKHLTLGCLFLLTAAGPCYYYFGGYPLKAVNKYIAPQCKLPILHNQTFEKSGSWTWRQADPQFKWYINTVYLDQRRSRPLIRVMAMSRETKRRNLFCQMWSNRKMLAVVKAEEQELWIHAWDMAKPGHFYQPYLLSCPKPLEIENPMAISISVDNPCTAPTHWLRVAPLSQGKQKGFVVCVKPLNFELDISSRLIEWLELQFLLGADNVFVYVKHVHPKTWRVLKNYENLGRVTLVNHTVPGEEVAGLWQRRRHEIAVYNDCLYRHLGTHRYVVNLDLDEAIVPVIYDSWSQLLVNHATSASVCVRCVYFFDDLGEETSIPQHLHMLRHIYRSSQFAPPGFAQKSFFATIHAETVSNHFALRTVHPNIRLLSGLNIQEARLHHYRKQCPPMMEHECAHNYMKFSQRDTLLWKYKDRLEKNVMLKMQELKNRDQGM